MIDADVVSMRKSYAALGAKAEFKALKAAVPTQLATWDDHDYCRNDVKTRHSSLLNPVDDDTLLVFGRLVATVHSVMR